jgi:outer membrane protein assembly factor BamA
MKLGSNIEYRFDILRKLKGAAFVDAGNVWLLHDIQGQTGGVFKFNSFADEIAIGSGLGLRFDFTFFIIRLDGAVQIKDPAMAPDKRWVFRVDRIKDVTFNFGIGYPF